MAEFEWTKKKQNVAIFLADGFPVVEVSEKTGVSERTIYRWKNDIEFQSEVDRLSLMVGIANKGERLRLAKKIIRGLEKKQHPTQKDLLEWVKYAQSETDGIKLDIASLIDAATSLAGSGSDGDNSEKESEK
jgi:uncharacterized protein YerC